MTQLILKLIDLKSKKNKNPEGFTSLEILVALIISLAFVGLSLQAIVTGMMLKVNAQQDQRADQLIQEDIERINDIAASLTFDINKCNAINPTDDTDIGYTHGYAQDLWDNLTTDTDDDTNNDDPSYEITTTEITIDGKEEDVMADGVFPISKTTSGKEVKDLADITDNELGIKLGLDVTHVSDGNDSNTKTLQIRYQVKEWDNVNISGNDRVIWKKDKNRNQIILAERYIEIIPDVALECP